MGSDGRSTDKIVVKRTPCSNPFSTTPHTSQLRQWGRTKDNAGTSFEIPAPQARGEHWGSQAASRCSAVLSNGGGIASCVCCNSGVDGGRSVPPFQWRTGALGAPGTERRTRFRFARPHTGLLLPLVMLAGPVENSACNRVNGPSAIGSLCKSCWHCLQLLLC